MSGGVLFYVTLWLVFLLPHKSITAKEIVGWTSKHQWCRMYLSSMSGRSFEERISCTNQPYFQYFEKLLQNPTSQFHYEAAEVILSLYDELEKNIEKYTYVINDRDSIEYYFPILSRKLMAEETSSSNPWKVTLRPISFSIPEELITRQVPPKSKSFCSVVPGNRTTYHREEDSYYNDIKSSLFTLTFKKAGWDCLRHYEILAQGSLPLFVDLSLLADEENESLFQTSLALHPKSLYSLLTRYPTLTMTLVYPENWSEKTWTIQNKHFDYPSETFDKQLYAAISMAALQYTNNVLSTTAMADYLLQSVQRAVVQQGYQPLGTHGQIRKVLYLAHDCFDFTGDYLVDTMLHGLKKLLGENTATVINLTRRSAMLRNLQQFDADALQNAKNGLYGRGMTFGLKLDTLSEDADGADEVEFDVHHTVKAITEHEFDLIILASGHRVNHFSPDSDPIFALLWPKVCDYYQRHEVVVMDGSDDGMNTTELDIYLYCAEHVFVRERLRYGGNPTF